MTSKEAYHITRPFSNNFKDIQTPSLLTSHLTNLFMAEKINLYSKENGYVSCIHYKKFREQFKINIPFYITSKGLITEEKYLLAQDIMEQIIPIKKRELIVGMKYKSIIGNEYVYIGDILLSFRPDDFSDFVTRYNLHLKGLLLNIKTGKLNYFSNIMLIEESNLYKEKIYFKNEELIFKIQNMVKSKHIDEKIKILKQDF